jgi:hypothetical protein
MGQFAQTNMTVMHAAGLAILVISLVLMPLVNNRIIFDFCLILLQTSLSLAPMLSYAGGAVTWWVRTLIIIVSFFTVPHDLEDASPGGGFPTARLPAPGVVTGSLRNHNDVHFRRGDAGKASLGILISYLFLSPDAFLLPAPKIAAMQMILLSGGYLLTVVKEGGYLHVATTPRTPKGQ